jgi:hypothetical protein
VRNCYEGCKSLSAVSACDRRPRRWRRIASGYRIHGYKGFDTAKVRAPLPGKEGDAFSEKTQESIRQAVLKEIGKEPTEVAVVCCDEKGSQLIFIGSPCESYRSFAYNPAPTGKYRPCPDVAAISSRLHDAIFAAVRKGGNAAAVELRKLL